MITRCHAQFQVSEQTQPSKDNSRAKTKDGSCSKDAGWQHLDGSWILGIPAKWAPADEYAVAAINRHSEGEAEVVFRPESPTEVGSAVRAL